MRRGFIMYIDFHRRRCAIFCVRHKLIANEVLSHLLLETDSSISTLSPYSAYAITRSCYTIKYYSFVIVQHDGRLSGLHKKAALVFGQCTIGSGYRSMPVTPVDSASRTVVATAFCGSDANILSWYTAVPSTVFQLMWHELTQSGLQKLQIPAIFATIFGTCIPRYFAWYTIMVCDTHEFLCSFCNLGCKTGIGIAICDLWFVTPREAAYWHSYNLHNAEYESFKTKERYNNI